MIHLFEGKGRRLFFPRQWANSVAAWLMSLQSPSGTIRITNTATPSSGSGPTIDVDMGAVGREVRKILDATYMTARDTREAIAGAADGSTIQANNWRLSVNEDWLDEWHARQDTPQPVAPTDTTGLSGGVEQVGSGYTAKATDEKSFATATNGGTTFYAVTRIATDGDANACLFLRKISVAADGRIYAIGQEEAAALVSQPL